MNNPPILFAQPRRRIQQTSTSQNTTLHQQAAPYTAPLVVAQNQTLTATASPYPKPLSMPWDWFGGGGAPSPTIDPSAHPGDLPLPVLLPSGATADFLQGHTYVGGVQVSPFVPQTMIQSTLANVPGFSDVQVFGIVGNSAGPFTIPPNVPSGANYVVSVKRTGPDVKGQPLPGNVIWMMDAGALTGGSPLAPIPPGQGGTEPSAGTGKVLGLEPGTFVLIALAGVVGIVLFTSYGEKSTRKLAHNPSGRRRIRR
jgi:hypothetical protein